MQHIVIIGPVDNFWIRNSIEWLKAYKVTLVHFSNSTECVKLQDNLFKQSFTLENTVLQKISKYFLRMLLLLVPQQKTAMNSWNLLEDISLAKQKAQAIQSLKPDIVIGFVFNQVASIMVYLSKSCDNTHIIGWGGDVIHAPTISIIHRMVAKKALRCITSLIIVSKSITDELSKRFNVENIFDLPWTASHLEDLMNNRYKSAPIIPNGNNDSIIFNARRFKSEFGGFHAFETCLELLEIDSSYKFVFVEGAGNTNEFSELKNRITLLPPKQQEKFFLFEGEIDFQKILQLLYQSDAFFSFRGYGDMRSLTVLQGMACQSIPIVDCGNKEWEIINQAGARATIVDATQHIEVAKKVHSLLKNNNDITSITNENLLYLRKNYDDEHNKEVFLQHLGLTI